ALINAQDAVDGKNPILVGVGNAQGAWSNKCGEFFVVPAIGVDEVNAVALSLQAPIHNMITQISDACTGDGDLDARVKGRNPPRGRAASGASGDAQARLVHLGASF